MIEQHTTAFSEIKIPKNVSAQIIQDSIYKIKIYAKKDLIQHIHFQIKNHCLNIENSALCQMFQSSENAFIQIHTPNLSKISSETQHRIFSTDTLYFPNISLINNTIKKVPSTHFDLILNNNSVYVEDNQIAKFELKGKTKKLNIAFYGGNCSLHAKHFQADSIQLYHRSNQHLYVYPTEIIEGSILSTGNVYAKYKPKKINVQQAYTGALIFE